MDKYKKAAFDTKGSFLHPFYFQGTTFSINSQCSGQLVSSLSQRDSQART
jgi:hypothetical protein